MIKINVYHHHLYDEQKMGVILHRLDLLVTQGGLIMNTLLDLQNKLVELGQTIVAEKVEVQSLLTDLKAQIKVLQDQIAAGSPVSQADLDSLVLSVNDIITGVKGISEPVVVPPVV